MRAMRPYVEIFPAGMDRIAVSIARVTGETEAGMREAVREGLREFMRPSIARQGFAYTALHISVAHNIDGKFGNSPPCVV
jgi:hypothetical protein